MLFIQFIKSTYQQVPTFFKLWLLYMISLLIISISINQISPFFIWSMYARPESPKSTYNFPIVIYNEQILANEPFYRDFYKMHIQYPLYNFLSYQQAGNKDLHKEKALHVLGSNKVIHNVYPHEMKWDSFFEQYQKMLFNKTGNILYSLEIKQVEVIFNKNGYPEKADEKTIYEYK